MAGNGGRRPTAIDLVALIAMLATVVALVALKVDGGTLASITGAMSGVYLMWNASGRQGSLEGHDKSKQEDRSEQD